MDCCWNNRTRQRQKGFLYRLFGAVSRYGLIAYASSLDQIGPITKSVEDAAIVFDAISKRDEKDSTSKGFVGDTYSKLNNDIKGMKIGIAKEYLEGIRDDVKEAVLKAADIYKSMGAEIVYFDLPELKFALPVYYIIACAEASSNLGRYDGIRFGYKTEHYNGRSEERRVGKECRIGCRSRWSPYH